MTFPIVHTVTNSQRLADLLRDAATAHHAYEIHTGRKDENWADWYAEWIIVRLPVAEDASNSAGFFQDLPRSTRTRA